MARKFKSIASAAAYIDNLHNLDRNCSVFLDLVDSTYFLQNEGHCWVNNIHYAIRRSKEGGWRLTTSKEYEQEA